MSEATLAFNILTKYRDSGADKAAKDMDRLGKSGSRMGATLKKAGAAGAVALAAGVVIAGKALTDATQSAIADEAAQKKLALALKKNAGATRQQIGATEQWITAQGKALGVTDDELRPALGKLVTATHDVGKAQKLASLAMDVSAGSGKSLDAVSTALMKAQNGQVSSLSRLGINTKNAAGETISMEKATKRMADTFGGQAAKHAGTLEGKMDRLHVVFDETKETVGAKLIPVVTSLAEFMLNKVGPALSQVGKWAKDNLAEPLKTVGGFIANDLVPTLRDLGGRALDGIRDGFKFVSDAVSDNKAELNDVWHVMKSVGGFILKTLGPALGITLKYAFRGVGYVIGYVIKAVGLVVKAFEKTVDAVKKAKEVFVNFKDGVGHAFDVIKDKVKTATAWVIDKVLWMAEKVLDGAVAAFGWAPGIGDKLKAARDKVVQFREDVNKELGKVGDETVNVTVKGFTKIIGSGNNQMDPTLGGLVPAHAKGGPIDGGTRGKDSVLAALMPGEHVFTTDEVRKGGGHKAMYAIRRMLRRGEFAKMGDVPAFASGGPVFSAAASSTGGLRKTFQGYATDQATTLAKAMQKRIAEILKKMGGEGSLSAAQIARGQAFAKSQVGDPYVWGGVGPNGFDCSGFVGAVLNAAQGRSPYSRRGTTGTMPWGGFKPGKGSFSAGWFTGNPGHMAGSIGGMGIESAGGVGVRIGGAATPVSSFPNVAHFDNGGMLQPGWTAAYNGTGRPERIPDPRRGGGDDYLGKIEIVIKGEDGQVIYQKLQKVKREKRAGLGLG